MPSLLTIITAAGMCQRLPTCIQNLNSEDRFKHDPKTFTDYRRSNIYIMFPDYN